MTERQREREKHASNTSNKGRVRGGRVRENDREATRERESHASNTSSQGGVRERERVTITEKQRERERHGCIQHE